MRYRNFQRFSCALALIGVVCAGSYAQGPAAKSPQPLPDTLTVKAGGRQTPQVVTIVHRVNGIKALVLMQRSGAMVDTVDDKLMTSTDAVTSITAGFALGDGQTVVARLSQAEAEAEAQTPLLAWSLTPPPSARVWDGPTPPAERAEFVVVESSGKRFAARYLGLDGGSGLSLLQISNLNVPPSRDASEERLSIGQRVRVLAPARIAVGGSNTEPSTVSVRVGEIEGKITAITRTSTGRIAHLTVSAHNLSPAIVGGIALNDAGETLGIVETSSAGKVRLIPVFAVRRAAERVLARKASVPRPWLGVRGEAVTATSLEKFHSIGWTAAEAAKLKESYAGILLTSVAPGTPAALADLRRGDVIVRVNNFDVKSTEDFSFVLNEAGGGATVNFTFFRGQTPTPPAGYAPVVPQTPVQPAQPLFSPQVFAQLKPLEVSVKMGAALNPARAMRLAEDYALSARTPNAPPPIARGFETVTLSNKAAAHLGARAGLLVVFVDPESAAARADLRVFDVIESVDGTPWPVALLASDPERLLLSVVRNRRKVEITIQQKNVPNK